MEGVDAQPVIEQISGPGALTSEATAYTLDLGTIGADGVPAMKLAIANFAAAPYGNTLAGTFAAATGSGFTITEPTVTSVAAGSVLGGLAITADTALGMHSETVTFNPTQTNSSGFSGNLTPITLTITDNVISPIAQPAATPSTINFDARVDGASNGSLTVANASPIGSDSLGVVLSDGNGDILPTQTTPLSPGASATLSLNSLAKTSGTFTDTLNIAYTSVPPSSTGHPTVAETGSTVGLSGTVYLPADPVLNTSTIDLGIVHQGDTEIGTAISITNAVASGLLSDSLIAHVSAVSTGLAATSTVPVTIDPGQTASVDGVSLDTSRAGVVNGTVTIDLMTHDGALQDAAVGSFTVNVTGTVIGDAIPSFVDIKGPAGTFSGGPGASDVLDLGTIPVDSFNQTVSFAIANAATGTGRLVQRFIDRLRRQLGSGSGRRPNIGTRCHVGHV